MLSEAVSAAIALLARCEDGARCRAVAAACDALAARVEVSGRDLRALVLGAGGGGLAALALLRAGARHVTVCEPRLYVAALCQELLAMPEHRTLTIELRLNEARTPRPECTRNFDGGRITCCSDLGEAKRRWHEPGAGEG